MAAQPDAEAQLRLLTFRNLQTDLATYFNDYRQGIMRAYPDVVLRRVAADQNADADDLLRARNRPAQNWKRLWRKRFQGHDLDGDIPVQIAASRVSRLLRSKGMDIRLIKVLGTGGQGMVSLWEINNRRIWKRVVIKSTVAEGGVLQREKMMTLNVKRARHTVQLLRFNGDIMQPKNDGSDETQDIQRWQQADNSLEILCLEYMKNGDVLHFLMRVGSLGMYVPNKVLWRIFTCLVKACVAMAYPPRHSKNLAYEDCWSDPPGLDDIEESLPNGPDDAIKYLAYDLVHFDLDGQNEVPVFKVGDFGLARPASDPANHAHNIWHIGILMHMIATQSLWTMPPAAIGPVNDHVAMAEMFPSPLEFKDFDRNPVRPFYTYGLWLSNKNSLNSELDVYLMMVLVRCLAADPEDRPSLRELLRWCSWRENDAHWDDQQESVRDWSDANINQPAPPPPSAAAAQPGLARIGPDVMERLADAAEMLRIGGLATRAEKAEQSRLRRVAPVGNIRQQFQDGEGPPPSPGVRRAPVGWWDTVVQSRFAQLQNLLNIGRLPSPADDPPPRDLRRRRPLNDLRGRYRAEEEDDLAL
ncbi:hypothetical protein J7T55_003633 [Diaporthe amygdali]|uniref:uncharacterized protein n=1 Tax=Phomopsis amygdali TaxID=1214568 RepID=UPI0022FE2CB6|nr:uncharacterized protein J7T55_003633 [Diaporthe amygdali]KAJ0117223.1 hypothetical protein J7T55_003633 [Diaporthe amygdali]